MGKYYVDAKEVIEERIAMLDEHLKELLEVNYFIRDGARVNAVLKAKNYWNNMRGVDCDS